MSRLRLQTDEPAERAMLVGWKLNWVFWTSINRVRLKDFLRSEWYHKRLFASTICMTVKLLMKVDSGYISSNQSGKCERERRAP